MQPIHCNTVPIAQSQIQQQQQAHIYQQQYQQPPLQGPQQPYYGGQQAPQYPPMATPNEGQVFNGQNNTNHSNYPDLQLSQQAYAPSAPLANDMMEGNITTY